MFAFVSLSMLLLAVTAPAFGYDEAGENDPSSAFSALRALSAGSGSKAVHVPTAAADDGVVMVMRRKRSSARLDDGVSEKPPSPSPSSHPSPSPSPAAPSVSPSPSAAPAKPKKLHPRSESEVPFSGDGSDGQREDDAGRSGEAALRSDARESRDRKEEEDASAPIAQTEDVADPGIDDATSIKNDDEIYKEAVEAEAVAPVHPIKHWHAPKRRERMVHSRKVKHVGKHWRHPDSAADELPVRKYLEVAAPSSKAREALKELDNMFRD